MKGFTVTLDQPASRLPSLAGGKGAALAKMHSAGIPVPRGFVVTSGAFKRSGFSLPKRLNHRLNTVDPADLEALEMLCHSARQAIAERGVPTDVADDVSAAYGNLGDNVPVAVRSSATAEDQPWASFAGQYDTFLNVVGPESLLNRILDVWASLYSTRAVAYRLPRIHRRRASGQCPEAARGCSCESGIMVSKQQSRPQNKEHPIDATTQPSRSHPNRV